MTPYEVMLASGHGDDRHFEIGIPMRDGIELAADVYLPRAGTGPTPVVFSMTPYDKSLGAWTFEARPYQDAGYAFVLVDCRGRGKSEGAWRAWVHDGADGHDTCEWIAAQPWCDGNVGTTGLSYMGWFQWATAVERPPHLKAMVSNSAAGRWQQEIPYTDGCFQFYFVWWVMMVRRRILDMHLLANWDIDAGLMTLPLDRLGDAIDPTGMTWRDMMDHDTLDEFWQALRYDDRYQHVDIPCLHVTGWYDLEDLLGAFHHYEQMIEKSPARDRQYLISGPWSHDMTRHPHHSYGGRHFGAAAAPDMTAIHIRWFDHWLKGIANGVDQDARVKLWEGGAERWVESDSWPRKTGERTLFLDARGGGRLTTGAPDAAGSLAYRYDPDDPAPTQMDVRKYPEEQVPLEQSAVEARADVLTFTSDVLDAPLVVSGWPRLELHATSDCEDTEWHIKVTEVFPDGTSWKVCQGCMRASYRGGNTDPEPLTPGEPARFPIEIWPIHHRFMPGNRVRVSITSSDFPWFARSVNRFGHIRDLADPLVATNTVLTGGDHASRLILPVVDEA